MLAMRRAKFSSVKGVMYDTQADNSKAHITIKKTPIHMPTHSRTDK